MSRDALVVGINAYQSLKNLKAPAFDAEAIAHRLQHDGDFRKVVRLPETIQKDDGGKIPVVSEKSSVSQQRLEKALEQLFLPESHQAPETALFYFSGHGIPAEGSFKIHDKGYLATSDTNPQNP
ncbi:MAG: caspase family protein, partial [Symploca sp. SIO2B6]|nr:caspase family protein [Symploca sp. SIO2B6]